MLNNLRTAIKHVSPYNHLITITVTHWDLLDQSERENSERKFREAFQKLNCSSVIFTSKVESGNETYLKILKEIVSSKVEQINITPQMLLQNYQIHKMDDEIEMNLCMIEGQLNQTLCLQNRSNKKAIENKIKENSTTLNIALEVLSMKQQTQDFLEKFEKRENAFDGFEFIDILYVHERLKTEAQVYLTDLLTFTKKLRGDTEKYFNNIVDSDKIQCSFEMNQEWKAKLNYVNNNIGIKFKKKLQNKNQVERDYEVYYIISINYSNSDLIKCFLIQIFVPSNIQDLKHVYFVVVELDKPKKPFVNLPLITLSLQLINQSQNLDHLFSLKKRSFQLVELLHLKLQFQYSLEEFGKNQNIFDDLNSLELLMVHEKLKQKLINRVEVEKFKCVIIFQL